MPRPETTTPRRTRGPTGRATGESAPGGAPGPPASGNSVALTEGRNDNAPPHREGSDGARRWPIGPGKRYSPTGQRGLV